ncbi:MAG: OmpH family outer membrane protein [Aureispira sp.]|nr:OmpH family outer membrane protein [Aureispira sp.]
MKKLFLYALVVACMAMTVDANAQKVAYIDAETIIQEMPDYKKAKSEVEAYGKQLQNQLKAEEEKVMKYYQDVMQKAQQGLLSPAQQKQEEEKLQGMQQSLQTKAVEADQKLAAKEGELTKPLYEKFNNALKSVAKEKGYGYIIDKKLMLYSGGGVDATIAVKAKLGL